MAAEQAGRAATRHGSGASAPGGPPIEEGRLWERIPRDEIREQLGEYREHIGEYMGRAREAIDDAVASELDDLRRAVRRQRKRLGI